LTLSSCERLVISSGNIVAWMIVGERRMIAKWSASRPVFARLEPIARLTHWLDEREAPVSAPRPTLDGWLHWRSTGSPSVPAPPDARDAFVAAYLATHPLSVEELDEVRVVIAKPIAGWPP
jgi:hypothetical protein